MRKGKDHGDIRKCEETGDCYGEEIEKNPECNCLIVIVEIWNKMKASE